jgi:hypothetical protein
LLTNSSYFEDWNQRQRVSTMLLFCIVSLIVFVQSCVDAAGLPSAEAIPVLPSTQHSIITRMAPAAEARPYGDTLDRMESEGGLLIGGADDEETVERRSAVAHAFGANYCDVKLQQEALPGTDERRLFENLLALIRDPKAPQIERLMIDDDEEILEISGVKFVISCDLLFFEIDAAQLDDLWKANAVLSELSPGVEKCMNWFGKIFLSKDGQTPQGRSMLTGRLVQVADFLNELATSDDLSNRTRAKDMLEVCVIANAGDCPDRAIAGLEDMEFHMALFKAPNLEQAVHFLIRQYKKQLIQEYLVDHQYAESAEEYVYLVLLLNDHFNLGVSSQGIWSAQCGARKPFDEAARLLMDSLSIDGVCHFIAKHPGFRSFLYSQADYQDAMETAATDPELAEDAVYACVRRIVEPYLYATFTLEGEKFQELTAADVAEMSAFLAEEVATTE